jgi:hypothetical protein
MLRKIILIVLFVFVSIDGRAEAYKELLLGWENLAKNNFAEVENHFLSATKDTATRDDAWLSMVFYHLSIHKNDLAFVDFNNFLKTCADPQSAIFAFENIGIQQSLSVDQRIAYYESIVQMPSTNETIKSMAYERLVFFYEEKREFNKMKDAGDKIGCILNWQLLGTFDNLSGGGYSEDFGAVKHPEQNYKFVDKNGAPISWFNLLPDRIRNDKWIDFDYYFYINNAIGYAQTFATVQEDLECQLRLGTSGSYKVWINDVLIMGEEEERNNDLDTYISTIKLSKGVNRILIQIGASEINKLNFMCRLTDVKGKAINNFSLSTDYTPYNKTYDFKGNIIPIFSEEYYKDKISRQPELLLNYFLLSSSYLRNDKSFEAAHILRDAEKMAPDCIYLLNIKAEQANRAKNYTGLSSILKKMKETAPDNYYALILEYQEMINSESYDKAEVIVEKIKEKYGEDESIYDKQIAIYAGTKQVEKMIRAIEDAYKKYPDNYGFVKYKYIVETKIHKNNAAGEKALTNYINKHQNYSAMEDLMEHYFNSNATNDASKILSQLAKGRPYAIGYLNKTARLNYLIGNTKKAHEYSDICHKIAPYIGGLYELDGDIYDAENKVEEAKQAYANCIVFSPTNYDARTKLRKLNNKKDIFNSFEVVDYKKLFENSPPAEKYPEDNSLIILDETQNIVYKGGASIRKNYFMVKVYNASGVDYWKEYYINYYNGQRMNVEEAFVMKKNGNKVDADRNNNHIVFTNLEINDAICITYKIEDYYSGKMAQRLNDMHYFNYFIPVLKSDYELVIDSSINFNYMVNHSDMKPKIKNIDEFNWYSWVELNKPGLSSENEMPSLTDLVPILRVSTFNSWDDVSKWYSSISGSKAKAGYEVKELMKELFPENEKLTQLEKAKRIYNYVVKEIRYSSVDFRQSGLIPQSTGDVINSRIGDCKDISTLYVTMCRQAGIEANLTLISTNNNGYEFLFTPTLDFNHCIASLIIDGKKYYVELTSDCIPFNSYTGDLTNASALEINSKSKNDLFKLPPPQLSSDRVIRNTTINFSGDVVRINKTNIKTGLNASLIRNTYRDIGKDQQEKTMRESLSDEYSSLKLTNLKFNDDLKGTSDSVTYSFSYTSDEAIGDIGGIRAIKLPFSDKIYSLSIISEEEREFPLVTNDKWFRMQNKETIYLTLPENTVLLKLPESKVYTSEFGSYSLTFKAEGPQYIITRDFVMKTMDPISPKQYPVFKTFMQKIIKADGTQLALK